MADDRNFIEPEKPAEIIEIEEAQEAIRDVQWWEVRLKALAFVTYLLFAAMWIIQDNDRAIIGLLLSAALWLYASTVLSYKVRRRRMVATNLINAFVRKKTLPLYHDLLEKFSDQPHLHIHLREDGTIVITDRRQK